jgi:hypothetical protein
MDNVARGRSQLRHIYKYGYMFGHWLSLIAELYFPRLSLEGLAAPKKGRVPQ